MSLLSGPLSRNAPWPCLCPWLLQNMGQAPMELFLMGKVHQEDPEVRAQTAAQEHCTKEDSLEQV